MSVADIFLVLEAFLNMFFDNLKSSFGGLEMSKRLSSKDFLRLFGELWQAGPKVKYHNPDAWLGYLTS